MAAGIAGGVSPHTCGVLRPPFEAVDAQEVAKAVGMQHTMQEVHCRVKDGHWSDKWRPCNGQRPSHARSALTEPLWLHRRSPSDSPTDLASHCRQAVSQSYCLVAQAEVGPYINLHHLPGTVAGAGASCSCLASRSPPTLEYCHAQQPPPELRAQG